MTNEPEFIFIDESGDPGTGGNPFFLLAAVHMDKNVLKKLRVHMAAFRYHHEVNKELKDWGALKKPKPTIQQRALLTCLCHLAESGEITTTVNWLDKNNYSGPYLSSGSDKLFRHFQLRLLLQRHRQRRPWGTEGDIVLDRWSMSSEDQDNLVTYLRGNRKLQPIGHVTIADSAYVEGVQIADIYLRMARQVVEDEAHEDVHKFCTKLMDIQQITRGLYG